MLQNDLFYFSKLRADGSVLKTNIQLNTEHPIFKGHFPDQAILPGVCMVQIVKEVAEDHIAKKLRLVKASDLKFLAIIQPEANKMIPMEIKINNEGELFRVEAKLLDGEEVLFKFKGLFR